MAIHFQLVQSGLHDLSNQLLELQLSWELLAEERRMLPSKIPSLLAGARTVARFLWETLQADIFFEPVKLDEVFDHVERRLQEEGQPIVCRRETRLPSVRGDRICLEWALYGTVLLTISGCSGAVRVSGGERSGKVFLLFQRGEDLPDCQGLPLNALGASTMETLLDLLRGRMIWDTGEFCAGIRVVLPAAEVSHPIHRPG